MAFLTLFISEILQNVTLMASEVLKVDSNRPPMAHVPHPPASDRKSSSILSNGRRPPSGNSVTFREAHYQSSENKDIDTVIKVKTDIEQSQFGNGHVVKIDQSPSHNMVIGDQNDNVIKSVTEIHQKSSSINQEDIEQDLSSGPSLGRDVTGSPSTQTSRKNSYDSMSEQNHNKDDDTPIIYYKKFGRSVKVPNVLTTNDSDAEKINQACNKEIATEVAHTEQNVDTNVTNETDLNETIRQSQHFSSSESKQSGKVHIENTIHAINSKHYVDAKVQNDDIEIEDDPSMSPSTSDISAFERSMWLRRRQMRRRKPNRRIYTTDVYETDGQMSMGGYMNKLNDDAAERRKTRSRDLKRRMSLTTADVDAISEVTSVNVKPDVNDTNTTLHINGDSPSQNSTDGTEILAQPLESNPKVNESMTRESSTSSIPKLNEVDGINNKNDNEQELTVESGHEIGMNDSIINDETEEEIVEYARNSDDDLQQTKAEPKSGTSDDLKHTEAESKSGHNVIEDDSRTENSQAEDKDGETFQETLDTTEIEKENENYDNEKCESNCSFENGRTVVQDNSEICETQNVTLHKNSDDFECKQEGSAHIDENLNGDTNENQIVVDKSDLQSQECQSLKTTSTKDRQQDEDNLGMCATGTKVGIHVNRSERQKLKPDMSSSDGESAYYERRLKREERLRKKHLKHRSRRKLDTDQNHEEKESSSEIDSSEKLLNNYKKKKLKDLCRELRLVRRAIAEIYGESKRAERLEKKPKSRKTKKGKEANKSTDDKQSTSIDNTETIDTKLENKHIQENHSQGCDKSVSLQEGNEFNCVEDNPQVGGDVDVKGQETELYDREHEIGEKTQNETNITSNSEQDNEIETVDSMTVLQADARDNEEDVSGKDKSHTEFDIPEEAEVKEQAINGHDTVVVSDSETKHCSEGTAESDSDVEKDSFVEDNAIETVREHIRRVRINEHIETLDSETNKIDAHNADLSYASRKCDITKADEGVDGNVTPLQNTDAMSDSMSDSDNEESSNDDVTETKHEHDDFLTETDSAIEKGEWKLNKPMNLYRYMYKTVYKKTEKKHFNSVQFLYY